MRSLPVAVEAPATIDMRLVLLVPVACVTGTSSTSHTQPSLSGSQRQAPVRAGKVHGVVVRVTRGSLQVAQRGIGGQHIISTMVNGQHGLRVHPL